MSEALPLPPEQFRFTGSNTRDAADFLAVGKRCANDLVAGLGSVGDSIVNCMEVLDWGCGCGRTLTRVAKVVWVASSTARQLNGAARI
jgi:hypothetical protein